jgi:hypothetical protein
MYLRQQKFFSDTVTEETKDISSVMEVDIIEPGQTHQHTKSPAKKRLLKN